MRKLEVRVGDRNGLVVLPKHTIWLYIPSVIQTFTYILVMYTSVIQRPVAHPLTTWLYLNHIGHIGTQNPGPIRHTALLRVSSRRRK